MSSKTKEPETSMDISALEKEIASVETNAVEEEKDNASSAYQILNEQIEKVEAQMPYPNTKRYESVSGLGYEYMARVKWEKDMNKPYWEEIDRLREYFDNGRLFCGHLSLGPQSEYYMMDTALETRLLKEGSGIRLVNVDDKNYSEVVKAWRYPNQTDKVLLSRNVEMNNKIVQSVEVVLDKNSEAYSTITDAYLRKALFRHRTGSSPDPGSNMQSIITTIQEKQDKIRSLNVRKSFVTQGCAGSGKTMVLLHRLRYLLFNRELSPEEYVFLVPSLNFKKFIKNISAEFRISERNIYSYLAYYQSLCRTKERYLIEEDTDELVFGAKFLSTVYSNGFFVKSYTKLFEELEYQTEELLKYSEEQLNTILSGEVQVIDTQIDAIRTETTAKIKETAEKILEHIASPLISMDDVPRILDEIGGIYTQNKEILDSLSNDDTEYSIDQLDPRLAENAVLRRLLDEIRNEEEAVKIASVFTAKAHEKKLTSLKDQYENEYNQVVQAIIEEERKNNDLLLADMKEIYEGITIDDINNVLERITLLYDEAVSKLEELEQSKSNVSEHIAEKYSEEIAALNDLIEISASIREESNKYVFKLIPAHEYFLSVMKRGMALTKAFVRRTKEDEKRIEKMRLFSARTDAQAQAYLNTLLWNECKKTLKDEFDVKVCKLYKHYWFINLYCQYLTRPQSNSKYGFVYIDEGQDLSKVEIELIYKINSELEPEDGLIRMPVMNIFGDVNQTITDHGISNWDDLGFISERFILDENFRNPNQIVEHYNNELSFKMKKIGVDMDPVDQFATIDAASSVLKGDRFKVCIVKDEYAKRDLQQEFANRRIEGATIYTVKEVKGLEFRETIVFTRDMTDNEKYIAYTRALVKLSIVNELDNHIDKNEKLFVQGSEEEEE